MAPEKSSRLLELATFPVVMLCLGGSCHIDDASEQGIPIAREEDYGPPPPLRSRIDLLAKLGREPRFLVGHGNDLPGEEKGFDFTQAGIYTLPVTLDIHYVYLSGLHGERGEKGPGWPDYDPGGTFVTKIAANAVQRGVVPMFTLYQAAARGETRMDVLADQDFMTRYWYGVRLLFEKLRELDRPAMVHLEPDFWGFAQQAARLTGEPSDVRAIVGTLVSECADLPADVSGMGRCILRLARDRAPKVAVGFHASGFGAIGRPKRVAKFLGQCGALEADFVVVDALDRDAGCFEAGDPYCQRSELAVYWDEKNERSPSFREHFEWARTIHERLGLPVLWWQVPLGVPSDIPGGTPKRYRDNRVRYFFDHTDELEEAGGFGAAFGVGAPNQTDITTDGGQFARAVTRYYEKPLPLARP